MFQKASRKSYRTLRNSLLAWPNAYLLDLPIDLTISLVFNAENLLPYHAPLLPSTVSADRISSRCLPFLL